MLRSGDREVVTDVRCRSRQEKMVTGTRRLLTQRLKAETAGLTHTCHVYRDVGYSQVVAPGTRRMRLKEERKWEGKRS